MVLGGDTPTMVPGIYTRHGTGHIHPVIPYYTTLGTPLLYIPHPTQHWLPVQPRAVSRNEALGSKPRLIMDMRRRETSWLPRV